MCTKEELLGCIFCVQKRDCRVELYNCLQKRCCRVVCVLNRCCRVVCVLNRCCRVVCVQKRLVYLYRRGFVVIRCVELCCTSAEEA